MRLVMTPITGRDENESTTEFLRFFLPTSCSVRVWGGGDSGAGTDTGT